MVVVAQLVRVLVCGAEGRRFEPGQPPRNAKVPRNRDFFCYNSIIKFLNNVSLLFVFSFIFDILKRKKMKAPSTFANLLSLLFILISLNGFSQTSTNETKNRKAQLTTLQNVVEEIKEKNSSIKNVECVNVMVNELLIEDLHEFIIDPKSIAAVEVLVLEPKAGAERINPSIIINTK